MLATKLTKINEAHYWSTRPAQSAFTVMLGLLLWLIIMTHSSIAPKPSPTWTPTVVAFCDEPKVLLDVDAQAQWLIRKAVTLGHPTNRQVEVPEAWAKEAVDIAVTELQTYSWSVQKITKAGKITQLVLKR